MFFEKTRVKLRLKTVAAGAVKSVLLGLEAVGDLPEKIWMDPYALGWISGFATVSAVAYALGNRLPNDAVSQSLASGEITAFAWEAIAPKARSMEILRRVSQFTKSSDPDFKRGSDTAAKTVLFGVGQPFDPEDADILAATKTAKMLAREGLFPEPDRSAITGLLISHLFYDFVRD